MTLITTLALTSSYSDNVIICMIVTVTATLTKTFEPVSPLISIICEKYRHDTS